jgi:hypothetical protein
MNPNPTYLSRAHAIRAAFALPSASNAVMILSAMRTRSSSNRSFAPVTYWMISLIGTWGNSGWALSFFDGSLCCPDDGSDLVDFFDHNRQLFVSL